MSEPYGSPLLADSVITPVSVTKRSQQRRPTHSAHSNPTNGRLTHSDNEEEYGSEEAVADDEEGEDVDDVRVYCCSLRMWNTLVLSFSLMLLFTAFNTIQAWLTNLLSTLGYSTLGNSSLTVLYVAVCFSLFLTPPLVHYLTQIRSIVVGAVCYVVYMASLIHILPAVVLVASAVNGFGASLLWVAVGGLLTKCSGRDDRGRNTGIFWSIFQLSLIIGNAIGFAVSTSASYSLLFIIFTVLGSAGTLLLLALRRFPSDADDRFTRPLNVGGDEVPNPPTIRAVTAYSSNEANGSRSSGGETSTLGLLRLMWSLFTSSSLLLLFPAFCFQGLEFSFWNGEFPLLLPTASLGPVMLFAGVGEALGGLTMGTLSDRIGRSATWLLGCIVYTIGLAGLYLVRQQVDGGGVQVGGVSVWCYVSALCFGLADAAINTQIYSILGNKYKSSSSSGSQSAAEDQQVVAAFTAFNLCQNVAAAIGFYYQPLVHVIGVSGEGGWSGSDVQLYVQLWGMVIGAIGFVICDLGWWSGSGASVEKAEASIKRPRRQRSLSSNSVDAEGMF